MARILHVSSSPRGDRSTSRKLAKEFLTTWVAEHPGDTVTDRDVGHAPPAHVTEPWVAAAYSPADTHSPEVAAAIAESDTLVAELFAHDVIVVSVPMYNFGIPSTLKAYIDNIVRVNKTFAMDFTQPNPYVPLVHGKKLYVLSSSGGAGYGPGGPLAGYNHETTYLQAIFAYIGVTDSTVVMCENANSPEPTKHDSFEAAKSAAHAAAAA